MNNSKIVEELEKFLERLEQQSQESVSKLNNFIDEDPVYGYAKAAGYAESRLDWVRIQSQAIRKVYLSN